MSILIERTRGTVTTVLGSASVNIYTKNHLCLQILVRATTPTTSFDVKLTDIFGDVTYEAEDTIGTLNELLTIPTYGNWTFQITGASVNEAFKYLFVFRDS